MFCQCQRGHVHFRSRRGVFDVFQVEEDSVGDVTSRLKVSICCNILKSNISILLFKRHSCRYGNVVAPAGGKESG